MQRTKAEYLALIERYIDGSIDAKQFEQEYLYLFKSDETKWDGLTFQVLDRLFSDVDQFCSDAELRVRVQGLGEQELLSAAQSAFSKLQR